MSRKSETKPDYRSEWRALWALVIGFFMILVDSTIVSVANPAIMAGLGIQNVSAIMWVTSAYLLTYAAPLLVTGRLGDRFGQRNIYLVGLTIFTLASAGCGLAAWLPGEAIVNLIGFRALQGLGASLMTPQTMAVITRLFPPKERGIAMGLWGSVAGIAMLFGPLLGGVLVDAFGWESIFLVNLPVGVVGWLLAWRWVPRFEKHQIRLGFGQIILSILGLALLIFGIQEGQTFHWGTITGLISVPLLIGVGLALLAVFVWWQAKTPDPLLPLSLLRDRTFSLANTAIALVGAAVTSWAIPLIFFYQITLGLTPTQSALMSAPSALITMACSPFVGRLIRRVDAAWAAAGGLGIAALGLLGYVWTLPLSLAIGWYLLPNALLGLGMAGVWGPISTAATRNLAAHHAGAGSGVYNTSRQLGSVTGSAITAAVMGALTPDWQPATVAHGMSLTLVFGVVTLVIALVTVLGFRERPKAVA